MTATSGTPATAESEEIGLGQRLLILFSCVMTVALYFTSILIASTVLPQMQGSFSATPDEISWSVTFNILATAIAMPMTGWLVARFGRSTVMIWSTGLFATTMVLCGLSSTVEELVLWRIVQGAAGAPSVPLVQTILLDVFPPRQHRMVLGLYGMGVTLGPIIGPTLGGVLAEVANWRWAFHVLFPVGALATIGLSASLPRDTRKGPTYLNWTGFVLLSTAIGALQWMLARGQRLDWFQSLEIQVALAVSVLAFYLFLAHSLTATRPFLDLRLLLNRNYTLGLLLITAFGMLNFTPMVLLPTLMRVHMGFPDMLVGQVVGSRGIGGLAGFFAVIFLARLDPRITIAIGFLLQAVAGFGLMHMDLNSTVLELEINGAIQGLSSGILVVALTLVSFVGIPREKMAEALSLYHLLRNIGASFFISISVAEVIRSTGMNYAQLSGLVTPYNRSLALPWVTGLWEVGTAPSLQRLSTEINRQSAMIAYINAFGLFTVVSAAVVPLVVLLRRPPKAP
ncbi:MAG: DHA2 family efflux MFS transporter permease subunit [Hyphomicrobiaceae bacterium]|nr:DHA2 family efflux MFS transporter permease subunit [Hyphomicrobiaceae bacterium]